MSAADEDLVLLACGGHQPAFARLVDYTAKLVWAHLMPQIRDRVLCEDGSIETETVDAGVETSAVEWARQQLLTAIGEAKGRVIASDLRSSMPVSLPPTSPPKCRLPPPGR